MTTTQLSKDTLSRPLRIVVVMLVLLTAFASMASAQESLAITAYSIDAGGGVSRGGSYTLTGIIAQPDAATSSGGPFTLMGGLLAPEQWRNWQPLIDR